MKKTGRKTAMSNIFSPDLVASSRKRAATSENPEMDSLGTKKRGRQSCDNCKSRKTKCVRTGDLGPCQHCISAGLECRMSVQPRKRPFYKVSEEEYESCMFLLRHFAPGTDLTLETMKSMIADIENQNTTQPQTQNITHQVEPQPQPPPLPEIAQSTHLLDLAETEESSILQEERGCMIIDSMGKFRYVGADSSLRFNHAVRAARLSTEGGSQRKLPNDPKVIAPLKSGHLPPTSPESVISSGQRFANLENGSISLPSREICMQYVSRFLQEVQCLYWFYSREQLYTALDKTLDDQGATSSASWLCSLFSIFALCAARPTSSEIPATDAKSSVEYLSMAKSLVPQTCDEADDESIKALALLTLALHSACYSVSAYLMFGTTVRIAFSLGMHRNISPKGRDSVERERGRRLWWTIYLLDQEIAIRLGYPCAIVDETTYIQTPLSSEEILDPGSNTPLGYQAVCISLVRQKKRISQSLYVIPAQSGGKVSFHQLTNCISSLRAWLVALPQHLRWNPSSIQAPHRRAICILHLRYWMTLIHVTRPFLLYTVVHASRLTNAWKRRRYEERSHSCIEAAENSSVILKYMMEHNVLSSLLLFDAGCIQEIVQIFLLARNTFTPLSWKDSLQFCVSAIQSMDRIGWCEKILPDIVALVDESGVLTEGPLVQEEVSANHPAVDETFFDQFQDFAFNMDAAQLASLDTLDLDFGSFSPSSFYIQFDR